MRVNKLYILALIAMLCFGLASCSDDDDVQNESELIKGDSWMLTGVSIIEVKTTDDAIYDDVLAYAKNYRVNPHQDATGADQYYWPYCSYYFTDDGKYYFSWGSEYGNSASGTYTLDGNNVAFDDATMTGQVRNNLLQITTDLRSRAATALNIDESLITKAVIREDYMHTVFFDPYQ